MNELNSEEIRNDAGVPEISDDQGKLGEIQIALPVVENMVRMITLEVDGVVDVLGGSSNAISGIFSNKGENRSGVRVSEDEAGGYSIEIRVSLQFGVELASVAYTIQSLVIDRIAKMTSKSVTKVDVFIDKVEKARPKPETTDEAPAKESTEKASKKKTSEPKPEKETKAD
ncbi:MAG: Asp23/Gls24 family envelope stress response protein [Puniceicoccaceae bacterium]